MRFLDRLLPRRRKRRERDFLVQRLSGDEVCVSRGVIEGLAVQCIGGHPELETAAVTMEGDGGWVWVEVVCKRRSPDSAPPVEEIQREIRRRIAEGTGLNVGEVTLRFEA